MTVTAAQIEQALQGYIDPYLGCDVVKAGMVKSIDVSAERTLVAVEAGFPTAGYGARLCTALAEAVATVPGAAPAEIVLDTKIVTHAVQKGVKPLPGVRNTIAVASGKGGVGKSTTAVNLALALHREGASVGLLDADIYGPSQPRMLGCPGRPDSRDGKSMEPKLAHGIQCISIGHLVEEDTPMIWRGPMATSALEQLLRETNWHDLDYLVIDLPPGTGDIQLTLCQRTHLTGAVVVSTPQDVALLDARKALDMFHKLKTPVLGLIENMSTYICPNCGHEAHLFGHGGVRAEAVKLGLPFLGELPLSLDVRIAGDSGTPVAAGDGATAQAYAALAGRLIAGGMA